MTVRYFQPCLGWKYLGGLQGSVTPGMRCSLGSSTQWVPVTIQPCLAVLFTCECPVCRPLQLMRDGMCWLCLYRSLAAETHMH